MLHNASASKTDLLLQCQWWANPAVRIPEEETVPDIPRFGRAVHRCLEFHLTGQPVLTDDVAELYDVDARRLVDYYERASKAIDQILAKRKWDRIPRTVEQKMAYDPFADTARMLKSQGERDYSGRRPTEMPGTADLALQPGPNGTRPLAVFDWKTGQSVYEAETNGQIHTLALGLSRYWRMKFDPVKDAKRVIAIGIIFRIDDEFMEISEAEITVEALEKHRVALRNAMRLTLSKTPAMFPGIHCKYCPALELCPAQGEPLRIVEASDLMMERAQVAHVYSRLQSAENLLKKVRERIKRYVEMNGPVELENGKELQIVEYSEENLSKSSIIRAKGRLDGEMLFAELRDLGVIEEIQKRDLRMVGNPRKK